MFLMLSLSKLRAGNAAGNDKSLLPRAEDGRANSDMRSAEVNCVLEIGAHPNAEKRQSVRTCELVKHREMRRRRFVRGRNAHKPPDRKLEPFPAKRDECGRFVRTYPGLLRFLAGVHLDEQQRNALSAIELGTERMRELRPVERMNGIEQRDRLADLVALQWPNEMKLQIRIIIFKGRPF